MTDVWEVWKSKKDGQWYFHRKNSGNNKIVGASEGYASKQGAMDEAVRQASEIGAVVIVKDPEEEDADE